MVQDMDQHQAVGLDRVVEFVERIDYNGVTCWRHMLECGMRSPVRFHEHHLRQVSPFDRNLRR